jgi:hypothetical protein
LAPLRTITAAELVGGSIGANFNATIPGGTSAAVAPTAFASGGGGGIGTQFAATAGTKGIVFIRFKS